MPKSSLSINLEIDRVGDSLRGRVVAAGGRAREFRGWLELLAALSALLDDPPAAGDASAPPGIPTN